MEGLPVPQICSRSGGVRESMPLLRNGSQNISQGRQCHSLTFAALMTTDMLPRDRRCAAVGLLAGHRLTVLQESSKGS